MERYARPSVAGSLSLILALAQAVLASACSEGAGKRAALDLLAAQDRAVVSGDKAAWMATMRPGDPEYLLERSRWFDYRLAAGLESWESSVEGVERAGPDGFLVRRRVRVAIPGPGGTREVAESRRLRLIGDRWFDDDLAWAELLTEHCALRYDPGIEASSRDRVAEAAESAWGLVMAGYGDAPSGRTVVKLYADRELLRHDSNISLGRLFNGWAESGESIKLWLRPDAAWRPVATLAHEMVHKASLAEAPQLCSWFAEGLANAYGSFPAFGGSFLELGRHAPADYDRPLSWVEGFDPDDVSDEGEWLVYSGMAAALVGCVAEDWGPDAPRRLVRALAGPPSLAGGYVWARDDPERRRRLYEAMERELGVGRDGLEAAWNARRRGRP